MFLFFDIDGTLSIPGNRVSDRVREAIRKVRERGHKAFLSTGRLESMVDPDVASIGWDGGIFSAGGRVKIGGKTLFDQTLPEEVTQKVMAEVSRQAVFYCLECPDGPYISELEETAFRSLDLEQMSSEFRRTFQETFLTGGMNRIADYKRTGAYKAIFFCRSMEAIDRIRQDLEGLIGVVTFENLVPDAPFISGETSSDRVNKGRALRMVLDYYGAAAAESAAFGDSMNDLSILQAAGTGIVMANAPESLKALGDRVCESVDEDGVALELARMGLIQG